MSTSECIKSLEELKSEIVMDYDKQYDFNKKNIEDFIENSNIIKQYICECDEKGTLKNNLINFGRGFSVKNCGIDIFVSFDIVNPYADKKNGESKFINIAAAIQACKNYRKHIHVINNRDTDDIQTYIETLITPWFADSNFVHRTQDCIDGEYIKTRMVNGKPIDLGKIYMSRSIYAVLPHDTLATIDYITAYSKMRLAHSYSLYPEVIPGAPALQKKRTSF